MEALPSAGPDHFLQPPRHTIWFFPKNFLLSISPAGRWTPHLKHERVFPIPCWLTGNGDPPDFDL